jgi:hypothetical protein
MRRRADSIDDCVAAFSASRTPAAEKFQHSRRPSAQHDSPLADVLVVVEDVVGVVRGLHVYQPVVDGVAVRLAYPVGVFVVASALRWAGLYRAALISLEFMSMVMVHPEVPRNSNGAGLGPRR